MVSKDPLDEIFIEYQKDIFKDKFGQWEIKKIDGKFVDWINRWGDQDKHHECRDSEKKITDFGLGYKQAIRDISDELKSEWKRYDKRTKDGFAKNE